MSFLKSTLRTAQQSAGNYGNNLFYRLVVNAEHGSTAGTFKTKDGDILTGRSEIVWFLGTPDRCPQLFYHKRKNSRDEYLCAGSLGLACPVCEERNALSKEDRPNHPYTAAFANIAIPVLSVRPDVKVVKGFSYQPVYWFELQNSSFIPEELENSQRLVELCDSHDFESSPIKIFMKDRGEKEKKSVHFKGLKYKDEYAIDTDHPLVMNFIDSDGNWAWDTDYYEFLEHIAIVRYKQLTHPDLDPAYTEAYNECLATFKKAKDSYPSPRTKLDLKHTDEDED